METYIQAKDLVNNPKFTRQRQVAVNGFGLAVIDEPLVTLIERFMKLPYCFTLQSCYGHFLHEHQTSTKNIEPLQIREDIREVEYRIAYIALCVENNEPGVELLKDLSELALIDPGYVQYGCAEWFWNRQVNSYVVQVEPERFKTRDRCMLAYQEALHIEKIRNDFLGGLREILEKRL